MAFDQSTRNFLQRTVTKCREILAGRWQAPTEGEFFRQLQEIYGISPDGVAAPMEVLAHLGDEDRETACVLRDTIDHYTAGLKASGKSEKDARREAVMRVAREQAFTVLNRLAALRMAEERGIVLECVRKGTQSEGFQLFLQSAGSAFGSTSSAYRAYLHLLFDELARDLGVLFNRFDKGSLIFPRHEALESLLKELNGTGEANHDASFSPEQVASLWGEDETVGWIYQYYNDPSERKKMREESSAPRNSRELAVRNQFFTPRYVVEFLTDNTLGRIWYEMTQGDTTLKEQCRYLVRRPTEIFLQPNETAPEQPKQDNLSQEDLLKQPVFILHRTFKDPRTILMLDPACGSMHFGLYAFDLFEVIYDEAWALEERLGVDALSRPPEMKSLHDTYAGKDAFLKDVPRLIIENNIHGIDIDPRAAQIAGLSLWLRAQKSWQRLGLKPAERPAIKRSNIVCAEPMPGEKELLREFVEREFPAAERAVCLRLLEAIFDKMQLAGEAGSLLKIEEEIRSAIEDAKKQWKAGPRMEQSQLFSGEKPKQQDIPLDYSGLTESEFWDQLEEKIYAALGYYAEQAEHEGGFQRRLFAEDAARGFAFIDVCRQRYDVVVMNPPFGQFSKLWKDEAVVVYPNSYNDILGAFVDSFVQRLHMGGRLGAITSRTCFFLTSFKDWREKVILNDAALTAVADLGQGVMDNAMVEAAAYVMERRLPEAVIPFIRAIAEHDKQAVMDACVAAYKEGNGERRLLLARQETFKKLPDSPFVYWVLPEDLKKLANHQPFEPECASVKQGLSTSDNPRFVRAVWEVKPEDTIFCYYPANGDLFCSFDDPVVIAYIQRRKAGEERWAFHVMAGSSQPWYSPITVKVNFADDGHELQNFKDSKGKPKGVLRNPLFYYRPGFSWTRRAVRFYPYAVPGNCIPSASRYMAFPKRGREFEALGVCSARVASAFMRFYGEKFEWPNFLVDNVKMLPWPTLDADSHTFFRELAVSEVRKRRTAYQNHEPFHEFLVPVKITDFSANGEALSFDATSLLGEPGEELVAQAYGLESDAALRVERDLVEAISFQKSGGTSDSDDDGDDDDSDFVLDFSEEAQNGALASYFTGVAFGRWDIRYATGEQAAPELPDPFAPLPVCPPGQLQNAQGLPARPEDVPAAYPVRIPWDGILVDDPNHPLDLERRVREVLEIIWSGKEGGPTAEAIEHEACEILGVKSLRDYFRKPAGFFADHLKRYSKSRRQAPIYWPLSTSSGSYTLWIYYHRLTPDTIYKCLQQFVEPKIKDVEQEIHRLRTMLTADEAGSKERKQLADAETLLNELKELHAELSLWAPKWKPNLNDGVLITASPLWKLFRLPKWRKDLEAWWKELEAGDYDWSHLAYTLFPARVREKCKTDRSIAIAHGLEDLCRVQAPVPKKKTSKKSSRAAAKTPAEVEPELLA